MNPVGWYKISEKKWSGPLSETKTIETMNEVGRYKISARATLHQKKMARISII
jgi:hypothetical protein